MDPPLAQPASHLRTWRPRWPGTSSAMDSLDDPAQWGSFQQAAWPDVTSALCAAWEGHRSPPRNPNTDKLRTAPRMPHGSARPGKMTPLPGTQSPLCLQACLLLPRASSQGWWLRHQTESCTKPPAHWLLPKTQARLGPLRPFPTAPGRLRHNPSCSALPLSASARAQFGNDGVPAIPRASVSPAAQTAEPERRARPRPAHLG